MNHRQLHQQIITMILAALLLAGCGNHPVAMTETMAPVILTETTAPVVMTETKTPPATMTWFGMQYSPETWHAETVDDNRLLHGLLTHLSIPHCQVMALTYDPIYIANYLPVQPQATPYYHEKTGSVTTTNNLKIILMTADNGTKNKLVYYEVHDNKAGLSYFKSLLGYFLFNQGQNVETCRKAFLKVLVTLQTEQWPGFQVIAGPQG